ncbi:MAG: hypothetical protein DRP57_04425 [Spirochaetes bacterium]|nr:MAG: hypothetical protein DRP57_04425 [Spirochaetota bacterium]
MAHFSLRKDLKSILKLGIPLLAGSLSGYFLQLADTIMVGRLGTESLAAIAIAGIVTSIFFVLSWPITVGTQTIVSRRYGKETVDDSLIPATGEVLLHSFMVAIFFGGISFFLAFFSKYLLGFLLKDPKLIELALSYINIIKWVFPVVGLYASMTGFLSAVNRTPVIMIASLSADFLNIFFNYILIFGKFGFPAMGIRGAALGTVLAQSVGFIYLVLYIVFSEKMRPYHVFNRNKLKPELMWGIVKFSFPVMVQNFFALSIILIYESIIGNIGALYLAVTHIVFSIFRINKTIVGGLARGAAILVGNSLGRNEKDHAIHYILSCEFIALLIGITVTGVTLIFPGTVIKIFNKDVQTIFIGIKALHFFAAFFFIEIMGFSFEMIFTHNGWGKYVLFSEFTTNVLFILGTTVLMIKVFDTGIYGAWLGFGLYQVFHALILTRGFFSKRWLLIKVEHEE